MKIGFQTSAYNGLSLREELIDAKEKEVDFFDIFFDGFLPHDFTQEETDLIDAIKSSGMEFTVHCPIKIMELDESEKEKLFCFIKKIKPATTTIHFSEVTFDFLEQIYMHLKDSTKICVENTIPDFNPKEKLNYLDFMKHASSHMKVYSTFDTGHCNVNETNRGSTSEKKIAEYAEKLISEGITIATIHAHDNLGLKDSHSFAGSGNIDFKAFLHVLTKNRQSPMVVIEHWEDREKSFLYLRKLGF